MITGQLKSDIDKLWETFWTGGITNPLTVIEQISFLMFIRLLDITETRNEKRAARTKKPFKRVFSENEQDLRWSRFRHHPNLDFVRDKVFGHLRKMGNGTSFNGYMADAQLMIQKESLLKQSIDMVQALSLESGDDKGDLYE